jgi:hypothetical protein
MFKALLMSLAVVAAAAAAPAASEPRSATGSLELRTTFELISDLVACPAGMPVGTTECRRRASTRVARGLGRVSLSYAWPLAVGPPACPADLAKPLAATGRLTVAGKGEIDFALAEGARCVLYNALPQNEPQELTITGGTGLFAPASGGGTVGGRAIGGGVGIETWTVTLVVPGVEFDLRPPRLSGARAKTVSVPKKAKNARVTFKITATDAVDGAVPVSCRPRSGSRFKIGRTTVRCEATDSSGNTAKATFKVTVKRRR